MCCINYNCNETRYFSLFFPNRTNSLCNICNVLNLYGFETQTPRPCVVGLDGNRESL